LVVVLAAAALVAVPRAAAWGSKGHEMTARVAAASLPKDLPAFFLRAGERLAYLCPEPDRWRGDTAPALNALHQPDHYFDLEAWGSAPLPARRYDLILEAVRRGLVTDSRSIRDLGTAHVAIAELAERLTTHFRQWRDTVPPAAQPTPAEARVRAQVEDNIIYTAGILAHFVTDLGNPMHCTVHHNGWDEKYPNPHGYPLVKDAKGLHSRFESVFVEQAINERDFSGKLWPLRRLGPWSEEMEKFIRRNNAMLEPIYQFDRQAEFGSGGESAEAKAFTTERLADAAAMLRDVWHTAWLVSGEEYLNESVVVFGRPGKSLLDLTRDTRRVQTRKYPFGVLVTAIGNRKNGAGGRYWMYYTGGKHGPQPADRYQPAPGERVEWKFEKSSR
jgi:hypothetical protein